MPYVVTLNSGLVDVVLPDGNRYQGGQVVTLSDVQYAQLSTTASAALFSSVVQQQRPALFATTGQPGSSVGVQGDWAFDSGSKTLYGPRGTSSWPAFSQMSGPTGTGWQFNGKAGLTGTDLYLTRVADSFGSGTAWYTTPQPVEGLDVTFDVEMSGGTGADGLTFAMADPSTATTFNGSSGGNLGLVGATATALALDTGSGSRARIVTTNATTMTTVVTYGSALTLRPNPVTVRVRYAGGVLQAWISAVQIFNQTISISANALLGFTGANGSNNDNHIVRNVSFTPRGGVVLH